MIRLFFQGNAILMGILTLLLLVILAISIYKFLQMSNGKVDFATTFRHQLTYIKSVGLFALVFGIFSQLLGLYQAFSFIETAGSISPAILAGGLKISTIPTLYGLIIFLISYLLWLGLDYKFSHNGVMPKTSE